MDVDPSRDALQLAILAPHTSAEKRTPLTPASLQSIDAHLRQHQGVRLGMESAASCGVLVLLHWLRQAYDVREVNPQVSRRLRECFTEAHTDATDAQGLAPTVRLHPDLPKVRVTSTTATWKKLSRARACLVKAQTGLYNRLHVLLTESYGVTYKRLFPRLKNKKALDFFQAFPALDDALADLPRVRKLLGEEKATLLKEAGGWGESFYLEAMCLEIRLVIQLLRSHREAIARVEEVMARPSSADPLAGRLRSYRGWE